VTRRPVSIRTWALRRAFAALWKSHVAPQGLTVEKAIAMAARDHPAALRVLLRVLEGAQRSV
jgi:hypothetical protein